MLTVAVPSFALEVTKGRPECAPLGETITNHFCGACVRHLFSENADKPGLSLIPGGLFDDTSWIYPCAHIWTRSAQRWVVIPSDVPSYSTQPESDSELLGLWKPRTAS